MRNPVFYLATRHVVEAGLQAQEFTAGLEDVESGFLQGDADGAADLSVLAEYVESGDPGSAVRRAQERRQHAHSGGLAAAVLSEETKHLSGSNPQIDAVDGMDVAEVLDEPVRFDRQIGVTTVLRRASAEVVDQAFGDGGGSAGHQRDRIGLAV